MGTTMHWRVRPWQREGRTSRTDAHARALNRQFNWRNWQNRQSTELAEVFAPHGPAGMLSMGRREPLGAGPGFPGPAMAAKATRAASRIPVRIMKSGCGHAVRRFESSGTRDFSMSTINRARDPRPLGRSSRGNVVGPASLEDGARKRPRSLSRNASTARKRRVRSLVINSDDEESDTGAFACSFACVL